jgi:hypothetical protein
VELRGAPLFKALVPASDGNWFLEVFAWSGISPSIEVAVHSRSPEKDGITYETDIRCGGDVAAPGELAQ